MEFAVTGATKNCSNLPPYQCNSCHKNLQEDLINRCSRCKVAIYCGRECQKKDWKAIHQKECHKPALDTTTLYIKENEGIRQNFSTYETQFLKKANLPKKFEHFKTEKYNHIFQTQQSILEGSSHLNPDTSVVVVCGAQFYGDKFVEPLPQLLEKCKKLVLLDVDPVTLETLHVKLGSSSKVSKVVLDLTCALKDLPAFYTDSSKSSPQEFISNMGIFLEKVTTDTEQRAAGLPGVLSETTSADYVVSSLVGSQLSIRLKEAMFSLFTKKFGSHISSAMTPQLLAKLSIVLQKSIHALTIKHTEDLCAWAGPKGRVYFADSYKFNENILVTKKTLNDLAQILDNRKGSNTLTQKEWHWIANQNNDYSVMSILS
jgi:hypothetical protein